MGKFRCAVLVDRDQTDPLVETFVVAYKVEMPDGSWWGDAYRGDEKGPESLNKAVAGVLRLVANAPEGVKKAIAESSLD